MRTRMPLVSLVVLASLHGTPAVPNPSGVPLAGPDAEVQARVAARNKAVGVPSVFLQKYMAFREQQLASASPDLLIVPLGFVKGLSRSFTGAGGRFALDLRSGAWVADLAGLTAGESYSLWLVDRNQHGAAAGRSKERTVKLADVEAATPSVQRAGTLAPAQVAGFSIDRVVLARGSSPEVPLASGSLGVMQKIFFRRLGLTTRPGSGLSFVESTPAPPLASLVPELAPQLTPGGPSLQEQGGGGNEAVPIDVLIGQGARLFTTETFNGNGRTCATCHPASNNFTIDTAFIAALPPDDPLFVAEQNPALAQLERPALLRGFGLILENVDGLEDPTNKFVMRGVPHTLGMTVSLQQDTSLPSPPAEMTGWSGDGAPGAGSLRDFATGAVTQHFTKTLQRVPNMDFRLPSEHELDAMEAFQLSLGREADFDLVALSFLDGDVDTGRLLFLDGTGDPLAGGRCGACHDSGGALVADGRNRNFNTNVENVVHPARTVLDFPADGGFGRTPNLDGSFGDRTFNTVSLVEAAETAPFFHNNVIGTLEDAVAFYSGPEFNGPLAPALRINLDATENAQVSAFLRGLNTLQNIDLAARELQEVLDMNGNPQGEVQACLSSASFDIGDALRVLDEGGLFPAAEALLAQARQLVVQAQQTSNPNRRRDVVSEAIGTLAEARGEIVAP